jgi:GT2 family glycosyltransferase
VSNRIGLVLLDYDQAEVTRRCLRSVAAGARQPDRVILVENGSSPVEIDSDELIASLDLTVLRPGRNLGAAGGRNLGVNELLEDTGVDRVALLDNDTVIPPDFFERAAEIEMDPLEIVAPLVLDHETGRVIYAGGDYDRHQVPRVISSWPEGSSERTEVDWAPTAALLLTRETWLRVGGFDAWYEFLWEDVEWCQRALEAGAVIHAEPRLRAMHEAHQSSGGAFSRERVRHWSRNGTVFLFESRRAGWRDRLAWFGLELRRVVREYRAGWSPTARGRLRGLAEGIGEVTRRRLARGRTTSSRA